MSDRIEKSIEVKATVSRVWRALTDHTEFGAWFGVKLDGPFVVGKASSGRKINPCEGYENVPWKTTVVRMEPERIFAFTWHPFAIDPKRDFSDETQTLVEFTLQPTATGTLVRVVESGFDKLPPERRLEAFPKHENGWVAQMENIAKHVHAA